MEDELAKSDSISGTITGGEWLGSQFNNILSSVGVDNPRSRPMAYEGEPDSAQDDNYVVQETASESPENRIRDSFSIAQLNYGYVITVGCHKFAIETHERVTEMIGQYLADPSGTERKWFANELKLKRKR